MDDSFKEGFLKVAGSGYYSKADAKDTARAASGGGLWGALTARKGKVLSRALKGSLVGGGVGVAAGELADYKFKRKKKKK